MPARRRAHAVSARATLGWGLLFFLALQLALAVSLDFWWVRVRDAFLGDRLARLRSRRADAPERPLVLMLGSSRTMIGFQAGLLNDSLCWHGEPVAAFNLGLPAAGPLRQRQCLRHLLEQGVRPSVLLLEVMPPLLNASGPERLSEEDWLDVPGLTAADVNLLRHFHSSPDWFCQTWARSRLVPGYQLRRRILDRVAPSWRPRTPEPIRVNAPDRSGWLAVDGSRLSAEMRAQQTEQACQHYAPAFRDFRVGDGPRQVLNDLLDLCRREQIRVALVVMPEGTAFRDCYGQAMRAELEAFLAALCRTHGAPLIDANTWVADTDFWDAHHLQSRGAAVFTRRLMNELTALPGEEWTTVKR